MVLVSRKSSRNKLLLLMLAAVLLVLLVVAILEKTGTINIFGSSASDTSTKGPTSEQKAEEQKTNADSKQAFLDDTYKDKSDTPPPTQPESASLNVSASQEGANVVVLTKIQSVAQGTCKLTASNGSVSDTQEADVIYQPEFSSCAGFSIPTSKLGPGTWAIKVAVTPTSRVDLTKSISIEVK